MCVGLGEDLRGLRKLIVFLSLLLLCKYKLLPKLYVPKDIERLTQSLPSARTHFSEFRRTLISKMRLYDMSLAEVTQLMSQILTESELNSFESAVASECEMPVRVI